MDPSQLPAGAMQALQQSGASGENITAILAQLAEMSPEEVSAALQSLGVQVDPDSIHEAAQSWVDEHSKELAAAGKGDEEQSAAEDTPSDPDYAQESAEPTQASTGNDEPEVEAGPDDAQTQEMEGEAADAQAQASPADVAQARVAQGGMPMPMRGASGGASGRGSPMDELISAQMMQGAAGNPNAAVPSAGGGRGIPLNSPAPVGANPDMRSMLSAIYKEQAGGGSGMPRGGAGGGNGSSKVGVPLGPRTGSDAGAASSPLTRIKPGKKIR